MPNQNGNAYALTTLCPMIEDSGQQLSPATIVRDLLNDLPTDEDSPMAKVPNTYLCRFFVLDDVVYEGKPARTEHLKSKYLVFTSNFYGDRDAYLQGMWRHAESFVRALFMYCRGFSGVHDGAAFAEYIRRCQVETTFFFNGSSDTPLAEQLKALYLKQELSSFAYEHQGMDAEALQQAFRSFLARVKPHELTGPTWRAGASSLEVAVIGEAR